MNKLFSNTSFNYMKTLIVLFVAIGCSLSVAFGEDEKEDDRPIGLRPRPPYRIWYQGNLVQEEPPLYLNTNWISGLGGTNTMALCKRRGIATSRWTYGPQSPHSRGRWEYYLGQCNPSLEDWSFAAIDIDEWIPAGRKDYAICARGIREAKKKWPDLFIASYVTDPDQPYFRELVAEGSVDLAIIEGYTNIYGNVNWRWEGVLHRCQLMQEAGLIDRTVVMYGHLSDGLTPDHLNRLAALVHDSYPQMPGIGLFPGAPGDREYEKALILYAERLMGMYHGDDVLFIDGFESGSFAEGGWQIEGEPSIPPGFTWGENDSGIRWTGGYFDACGVGAPATAELLGPGSVEVDILPIVREWLTEEKPNRGLLVQLGGPVSGLHGQSKSARFRSTRDPNQEQTPRLRIELRGDGKSESLNLKPVVDGYLTLTGQRLTLEPGLQTFYDHGQNHGAIYLRFDLSRITGENLEAMSEATLLLHATRVDNPRGEKLQVTRIHEENANTEPFVMGADAAKAAYLKSGASITRQVNTRGREHIRLHYRYQGINLQAGDRLRIDWYDGEEWNKIREVSHRTEFVSANDDLPPNAEDNGQFAIRFSVLGGPTAAAWVDLVRLTGLSRP